MFSPSLADSHELPRQHASTEIAACKRRIYQYLIIKSETVTKRETIANKKLTPDEHGKKNDKLAPPTPGTYGWIDVRKDGKEKGVKGADEYARLLQLISPGSCKKKL